MARRLRINHMAHGSWLMAHGSTITNYELRIKNYAQAQAQRLTTTNYSHSSTINH